MTAPVIRLTGIEKFYPGVKSLDSVDFDVAPGEIHALLGENGAGKSTLTAVMGGAVKPNAGTIEYLGRIVAWRSPKEAQAAGIHVIHQELALFPELTVAENILLTDQPRGPLGLISPRARLKRVQTALDSLGVSISASARIGDLTLADQQMVEIAKALVGEPRLLVFDEPTAVIAGREVDLLFDNMRKMRSRGIGIVYISHRLDEIFEVADRVTILKDGKLVGTHPIGSLTRDGMINLMVGRRLEQIFPPRPAKPTQGRVVLAVDRLSAGDRVKDVSLSVREGEIVAIAGMVGSGRTEVAEAVFGARAVESGAIAIDGETIPRRGPRQSIRRGVGFLTEDRKDKGLFLGLSVASNIVAPALDEITRKGLLDRSKESDIGRRQISSFSIAAPSPDTRVGALSGGNQQKVLFSRWARIADRLLILDEPTRGVDVGAKVEIYHMIRSLADQGVAVLMISSELAEVVGLADRVVVMAQGRVTGELSGDELSEESVMRLAVHTQDRSAAGTIQ
jgi:ribose transport system ATP-binding protein